MIAEVLLCLLFLIFGYFIFLHLKVCYRFKKYNVKFVPGYPLFGNRFKSLMGFRTDLDDITEIYNTFPNERYVGYIEGTTPIVLVRDPELGKRMIVDHFDHFEGHQFLGTSVDIDSYMGNSLFMISGQKWRRMRQTLSPAFTPAKIKLMLPFLQQSGENALVYLKDKKGDLDAFDFMRRYATDTLGATCFGLNINSYEDTENEFFAMGVNLQKFSVAQFLSVLLSTVFPWICKKLDIQLFSRRVKRNLRQLTKDTVEHRQKNNVNRPDMFQHFAKVTNEFNLDEMSAQTFFFYLAGVGPVASILSLLVHEIVLQPRIQEKLFQEIFEHNKKYGGFSLDTLKELPYLDACYNETMRKWAVTIVLDRVCVKPFTIPPEKPGEKPYPIKKGEIMYYAMNSVMMDPKYFPEPAKFYPERFMDKANIKPYTYEPLGMGPKYCIGAKLAILQIKVMMYNLLLKYKLLKSDRMGDELIIHPTEFLPVAKDGTWIRVEARE